MVASDTGNVEVVDKLLQYGATVDLQHQIMIMHMPIILLLFIMYTIKDVWSSLIIASLNGHAEVVDKLLQHGATIDLLKEVWSHYSTCHFMYACADTVSVCSLPFPYL